MILNKNLRICSNKKLMILWKESCLGIKNNSFKTSPSNNIFALSDLYQSVNNNKNKAFKKAENSCRHFLAKEENLLCLYSSNSANVTPCLEINSRGLEILDKSDRCVCIYDIVVLIHLSHNQIFSSFLN